MPSRNSHRSLPLRQGLDQEVYSIIIKYVDGPIQYNDNLPPKISVPIIFQHIKNSNSSLARKSKKLLEDSIARVLEVIKQDADSEDDMGSVEGDFEVMENDDTLPMNGMNKSVVGLWQSSKTKPTVCSSATTAADKAQPTPTPSKKRAVNGEPPAKRRKVAPEVDRSPPTHVNFEALGGADEVMGELLDLTVSPLIETERLTKANIQPTRGILLFGPPGCGKTMIANVLAAELGVPFIAVSAPSIVSGMSGESEKAIRDVFDEAKRLAPCLVFIDEIDAVTPKRENSQREMEKRIVAQLLTCMDDLDLQKTGGKAVIVLAATNRPDSLDPALRRGGRFDKEINIGVPDETVRCLILKTLTRDMPVSKDFPFKDFAKKTPGFVGADLADLVSTAAQVALKRDLAGLQARVESNGMEVDNDKTSNPGRALEFRRIIHGAKERAKGSLEADDAVLQITKEDFYTALPKIQPSAKREGFATIPETTWTNIGALQPVRKELMKAIIRPIKFPEIYRNLGIPTPTGVLLWGPPGCGKTLLAKAVANESKANFISVKGPELLNKYVGESERAVRQVFVRARSSIPCVIFFDELDALVPKRDDSLSEASAKVVNTLLTELDGLSSRSGIYVIAATNRPDIIDPAMLRPGRLGTRIFVDFPGAAERVEILKTLCLNSKIAYTDQIGGVAEACECFSGADLESLLRSAGDRAIDRYDIEKGVEGIDENFVKMEDFESAKAEIQPSVSESDRRKYSNLKERWGGIR